MRHEIARSLYKYLFQCIEGWEVLICYWLMEEWPSTLYWLELWRVRRKRIEDNILWNRELPERMKSCLINEENNHTIVFLIFFSSCFSLFRESSCFCKFTESETHNICRNTRKEKHLTLTCFWTDKSIYILPFIPSTMMSQGTISCSLLCPYSSHNRMQSYTCFIFCPDLNGFVWIVSLEILERFLEFFLKPSCSS